MKAAAKLILILDWLVAIGLGVFCILWGVTSISDRMGDYLAQFFQFASGSRGKALFYEGGSVLIIVNFLVAYWYYHNSRYDSYIRYRNEDGSILVNVSAVENALEGVLRGRPSVQAGKVSVLVFRHGKRPPRVVATVSLHEVSSIPGTVTSLQGSLKDRFQELLDYKEPFEITVRVKKVIAEGDKASPEDREFRGPQYPIGDEEKL
ncbi:MAG: hypothetical protein V1809_13710 [Planctomycetota bacterium]